MTRKRANLSEQLRAAVDASDRTHYRIALDAEVDHASLSRFMHGSGLSSDGIDKLAETLGLELKPKRPTKKRTPTRKGR